jgi:hypothetical protein
MRTLRKDFASYLAGPVFVRGPGRTIQARPDDIRTPGRLAPTWISAELAQLAPPGDAGLAGWKHPHLLVGCQDWSPEADPAAHIEMAAVCLVPHPGPGADRRAVEMPRGNDVLNVRMLNRAVQR